MKKLFILLFVLFSPRIFSQGSWMQKANYPGQVIMTGVGFTIGNKGYLGTGMDGSSISYNEFYEYDPIADTWTAKASFPGTARHFAVGFSIGNKGYIGTGFNSPNYYNDFWEYDLAADAWTQKANVPGPARATAMAFSFSGKGYVGSGAGGTALQDMWEYDPGPNTWIQKANYGGGVRMDMERPFVIGSKLYCGNGWNGPYYNDFWEYDILNDVWTQKANFAGTARFGCTGFAICNHGYIGFGQSLSTTMNSDMWKYTPASNSWMQVASIPVGRIDAPVFVIADKAYIGPGGNANVFWEYTPDSCDAKSGFEEFSEQIFVSVYPNPSKGIFTVSSQLRKGEVVVYSYAYEKIYSTKISTDKTEIDLSEVPSGVYFIEIISDEVAITKKIIKN